MMDVWALDEYERYLKNVIKGKIEGREAAEDLDEAI